MILVCEACWTTPEGGRAHYWEPCVTLQVSGIEPAATDAAWQLPATERSVRVLAEKHSPIDGLTVPRLPLDAHERSAAILLPRQILPKTKRGCEPPTSSLGSSPQGDASVASKGLTTSPFLSCPRCCPSQQVWLHENDTGVSPVETIMVMVEELLQSAGANDCFRLSLVLGDESSVVRVDTTAMPNGIVYTQVDEMA